MTEKKEYKIRINGTQVTVSREVYTVYYRTDRHAAALKEKGRAAWEGVLPRPGYGRASGGGAAQRSGGRRGGAGHRQPPAGEAPEEYRPPLQAGAGAHPGPLFRGAHRASMR